jgi:hypothetical protein
MATPYRERGNADAGYGGSGNDIAEINGRSNGHVDGGAGQDTVSFHWDAVANGYHHAVHLDVRADNPAATATLTPTSSDSLAVSLTGT